MPRESEPVFAEPEISQDSQRHWRGYGSRVFVGWLLLAAATLGLGWLVIDGLSATAVGHWDRDLPQEWEQARTATMNSWTQIGSTGADTLFVIAVACFVGSLLLFLKRWASTLLLATSLLIEVTIFTLTAWLVGRDRPEVEQLDVSPPTSSFPSGHTAAATALYVGLTVLVWWNFKSKLATWVAAALAVILILVVGLSRIYRGMHHPTDVLAGVLLGLGCVFVAYLAVRAWVGRTKDVLPEMHLTHAAEEIR